MKFLTERFGLQFGKKLTQSYPINYFTGKTESISQTSDSHPTPIGPYYPAPRSLINSTMLGQKVFNK